MPHNNNSCPNLSFNTDCPLLKLHETASVTETWTA